MIPATYQAIAERKFYDWREVDNNGEYNNKTNVFSDIFMKCQLFSLQTFMFSPKLS